MRKRSKRAVRPTSIPTIVFSQTMPEVEIATLSALAAFQGGYASQGQFDILLDTRDLLMLAAQHKNDSGVLAVCLVANVILGRVRDSWDGEKFQSVDEDQLNALRSLVVVSTDFWKRQSGATYQKSYQELKVWRKKQGEKNEGRCDENGPSETWVVCGGVQ